MGLRVEPSEEEFRTMAARGNLITVSADLMADFETPVSVYSKLSHGGPSFLFESIAGGERISRYSFAGCNPKQIIEVRPTESTVRHRDGRVEHLPTPADPLDLIEQMMAVYQPVERENLPPFVGGAVGLIGYEYIHSVEPTVPMPKHDTLKMPVLYFILVDRVVAFDHARQLIRLCVSVETGDGISATDAYTEAVTALEEMEKLLRQPREIAPAPMTEIAIPEPPPGNFTQPEFESLVERCRDYIKAGDAIQIVGSQRFEREYSHRPLDLYRALRVVNPSPYMFILDAGDFAAVGASPEVHVRLTGRKAEVRPIAGTRPRGMNAEEDARLEKDLLADEKERAEHLMLVDLARNDLGRVCKYGTVEVKEYAIIERYSHVMHIVSQVEGELAEGCNAYDLMRATFPAGTVSGAPKVRAMQIIAELEQLQRGPYAGALGYFSFNGNSDSCIAIRTALIKDGNITIQSGAGLVADSVPASEFQETINKARGMFKAVALSESMESLKF